MRGPVTHDGPLVVTEKARSVDVVWGFLTVVFAVALVRGHLGAGSATGRIAVDAGMGLLFAGSAGGWWWFRRHPARLEVTPEEIAFVHRGRRRSATILRGAGDLAIRTRHLGGQNRLHFLTGAGSEEAIPLTTFDHAEVETACRAQGWRFDGDL
ncbi:MAG TPA: hypothetical protein VK915_08965 [Gaiellaceae bacterium]|nr:hypothetical protein [Gaiellaceae bacterium]